MQKRPRQTDVAKLAGVSPATVSVILNNRLDGNVRISAETRARVLDAVEQLGYVTDPVARSLAGGRGSILGVFTYEAIFPRQLHHCYYPFLLGMEEEAAQLGYDLLLLTSTGNTDRRRTIYQGNINRLRIANGTVIRMPAQPNTVYEEEIARLIAEQYPFVAVGEHEWSNGAFSSVTADYATATANVVRIMLAQGHRRVAYWAPQHVGQDHRACYAGYLMAHRQLGLAHVAMPAQQFPATHITTTLLQHLLAEGTTAFVLEHDLSVPFCQALEELGKRAPTDLSFAILGDRPADFAAPYPITGFSPPHEQMGRRAVHLLVALLQTAHSKHSPVSQGRHEVLPCIPFPGATIGPPPVSLAG